MGIQPNQSLARQGSLYNLTLNEVESHLGEPLSSMNLDELLKTVIPSGDLFASDDHYASNSTGLRREGSITMSRALSKKTVDEVWRDIQQGQNGNNEDPNPFHERQATLGEMTLEDFLVKAGVVSEGPSNNVGPGLVPDSGSTHWLQQYNQMPVGVGSIAALDALYSEGQLSLSPPTVGRVPEKLVERRQKRMIKNRESAARSRARKQAYTQELENKVSRLEDNIDRLKKEKKFEIVYVSHPEPKHQLRRTSSASF